MKPEKDKRACIDFVGGEDAGLKRLDDYVWKTKFVGNYADLRNNLMGD